MKKLKPENEFHQSEYLKLKHIVEMKNNTPANVTLRKCVSSNL